MSINALILSGDGINCELETAYAFKKAGATTHIISVTDFLEFDSLDEFDILAIPGGFSYGDEIRSGKILSEKIKTYQLENLKKFNADKKPIIGICNGFQILTQLGVFNEEEKRSYTLSENTQAKFINKWTTLNIIDQNNFWFKDLPKQIDLPIRHKEGNLKMNKSGHARVALTYQSNENGSHNNIAGLLNAEGNILGLMPHPEAAINKLLLPNHKDKKNEDALALQIFKNAVDYMKGIKAKGVKNEH